jgi:hypothetical protein
MTEFIETIENFKVSFGGKNSIDAELFTKTINNTIELIKASANAIEPNCFLRLEIKTNQDGSFETIIDAIVKHSSNLLTKDNARLACEVIAGFLAFLQIKQHLNGRKAKKIENNNNETAIKNQDNQIIKVPKEIGNAYFQNNKIDNIIINNFTILTDRSDYSITTNNQKITINQKSFENMSQPLVDENPTARTIKQKPIEVDLLLKKPDLLGDSKWQFVYNKTIEAKIEDEVFLEKIRKGKISIRAGIKIPCLMEIEYDLSDRLDLIPKSEKYNIKKITGEIIEPEEDSQESLFS